MHLSHLMQLAAHLREPATIDHFSMSEYIFAGFDAEGEELDYLTVEASLTRCGSYGCIAGHALLLADPSGPVKEVYSRAREWLGLTPFQAYQLFRPDEWEIDWELIDNKIAADVVEQLAETGEVVWPEEVRNPNDGPEVWDDDPIADEPDDDE